MSRRMLIDAAHGEETRVAVVSDQQVDDFDFETKGKEQLRGNIYLAKVTRVEPSLQAAFVEYGGNRHGFLAFSEIHPDYYQLPQADREALLKEAAAEAAAQGDEDNGYDPDEDDDDVESVAEDDIGADGANGEAAADDSASGAGDDTQKSRARPATNGRGGRTRRPPRNSFLKKYKIQEVIRRRQVMLVQVVKEERGNKGAALTTYLSLAGRYSVLMPNTPRGGGISRKIANQADRKRLKEIVRELDVPEGMGLIVRTAGAKRTKTDLKRDYDYLIKLWDTIREKTLSSMAPCLINEEGDLVHRAMRDMFVKELEEVLIQGESAYREAKDLAKLIMPSQARKVKQWKEPVPIFVEFGIEDQLDSIFSPVVQLKSGGYLVINQTEALVAIDVNSGKSTKARNIEQTALQTNLEAAEEACRQMRLRDLAGLIVIDFIDMDEKKNNRAVEKAVKDYMKVDRSRIQYDRISQFGLMEISRQRRRAGFLQATSDPCPACNGTGRVRSVPSAALQLIRAIEARAAMGALKSITVEAPTEVALFLLNNKRDEVAAIEERAGFAITVTSSDTMLAGDFTLHAERDPNAKPRERRRRTTRSHAADTSGALDVIDADTDEKSDTAEETAAGAAPESEADDQPKPKRRRRGRRGGRRRRRTSEESGTSDRSSTAGTASEELPVIDPDAVSPRKGEVIPEDGGAWLDGVSLSPDEMLENAEAARAELQAEEQGEARTAQPAAADKEETPSRKPRRRRRPTADKAAEPEGPAETDSEDSAPEPTAESAGEAPSPLPDTGSPKAAPPEKLAEDVPPETPKPAAPAPPEAEPQPEPANELEEEKKPRRRGWWNRRRA